MSLVDSLLPCKIVVKSKNADGNSASEFKDITEKPMPGIIAEWMYQNTTL